MTDNIISVRHELEEPDFCRGCPCLNDEDWAVYYGCNLRFFDESYYSHDVDEDGVKIRRPQACKDAMKATVDDIGIQKPPGLSSKTVMMNFKQAGPKPIRRIEDPYE